MYDDRLICFTVMFPTTIHILDRDMGIDTASEEPCKLCHHFPRSRFGLVDNRFFYWGSWFNQLISAGNPQTQFSTAWGCGFSSKWICSHSNRGLYHIYIYICIYNYNIIESQLMEVIAMAIPISPAACSHFTWAPSPPGQRARNDASASLTKRYFDDTYYINITVYAISYIWWW